MVLGLLDLTADLVIVVSDRIAKVFNRFGATPAIAFDIPKAFDRVWHAGLLHNLKSYGISGQIFRLILSFLSNRRLRVVHDWKFSQEYPVNAGVVQGSILFSAPFLLYNNDLLDDVIFNIVIYANDTIIYSKCDLASDLWQKQNRLLILNLIYETLWSGAESGSLILMLEKLNCFCLTGVTRN